MLLIVKLASGPVSPSLAGVYMGNVLAPLGMGVVNKVMSRSMGVTRR